MITDYIIAVGETREVIMEKVMVFILNGYEPVGGCFLDKKGFNYCQAMIKREEKV